MPPPATALVPPPADALACAAVKPKNHFGAVLVLVILIAVCGGVGYSDAATYLGGEKATAHVGDCHTEQRRGRRGRTTTVTVCEGTWKTADGQSHEGEIEGAEQSDSGQDIAVRVDGDKAVVDEPFQNLWPVGGACLLTVVLVIYIGYLVTRRGGGSGPPAGPPPGNPYGGRPPQQPYPQQWPGHGQHPPHHPPGPYPQHPQRAPYPPAPPYPPPGHHPQGRPGYPPHPPQQRW